MEKRKGIAEELVEATRREAVGEVAKGVARCVKAALVAAFAVICALVWSLWTANPVATIALAVVSLSLGVAVGSAVGWRRACKAKDEEIDDALEMLGKSPVDVIYLVDSYGYSCNIER